MPRKKSETPTAPTAAVKPAPRRRASRTASPKTSNGSATHAPSFDQIAEAAYLRYVKRGGTGGSDFDDWLEAERELLGGK